MEDHLIHMQIYYEIAMAIGTQLDLQKMLKESLSMYLRKLNCLAGIIFQRDMTIDSAYIIKQIFALPRAALHSKMCIPLLKKIPSEFIGKSYEEFYRRLPIIGNCGQKRYFHIMELPNFGLIGLIKSSSPFDQMIIESLKPLNAKLANSCIACVQNQRITDEILERKQTEEEKIRLATAIEQAAECIIITDRNGIIEYVNPAFSKITGYRKDEVIGKNPSILKSNTHPASFYKNLWGSISNGHVWKGKFVNRKKDGSLYTEEATISPVRNENGEIVNFVAVKKDITRESELEMLLLKAQKMEAIGTLAGGIAHDFNNLLSPIIGFSEISLNGLIEKDSKLYRYLSNIRDSGLKAKDLIKQILTFSRETTKDVTPINLTPIFKEILTFLRYSLPKTIDIRYDIDTRFLIMANPTQIYQVILNICTNASHAMQENGGILSICLNDIFIDKNGTKPDLNAGHYVKLSISDTGHGMTKEIMEHIFDPFFTTKKEGVGTGLGLSVVHGIVKSFNGKIYAESEPEKGSTFDIFFPAIKGRLGFLTDETTPLSLGKERILFVDDEHYVVEMGKDLLASLGYNVTTFTSSITALNRFKKAPDSWDIVILDMTMPHMTGDDLAREMLKIRPQIPIIICTGFSSKIDEKRAKEIGIKALIMKPIIKRDIAITIRRVIDENYMKGNP